MKLTFLAFSFIGFLSYSGMAQTWNMNMLTDSISINGPYTDTRAIVVSERQMRYTEPVKKFGLHFRNNLINEMTNNVNIANLFGSPIIGAHGSRTVVNYSGNFQSAGGQSFPSLCVLDSGKIVLTAASRINLVLAGSFFTRQFWCLGDGTGTVEFAPGFVADRTNQGAVADGLGSIRFSNCNFVTHETQGLPLGYRPNPAMINSHLVFEGQPGSRWITKSNTQDYKGGLWVRVNMSVEAQSDLLLSGVRSVWSDYTNFGGIFLENPGLTLAKEGSSTLTITGEQGYNIGATMVIRTGLVNFVSNPYVASDSTFYRSQNRQTGQNLEIRLEQNGTAQFSGTQAHIRKLAVTSDNAVVRVSRGATVLAKEAEFAGTFRFDIPSGIRLAVGDSFQVFGVNAQVGRFSNLVLPTYGGAISWDTSGFYSRGILKVAAGDIITGFDAKIIAAQVRVYPNPTKDWLSLELPQHESADLWIYDATGKEFSTHKQVKQGEKIMIKGQPKGLFYYKICLQNGLSKTGKLLIQ